MENQLDLVGESPAESDTDGNKQVSVTPERVPGYGELLYDKIRTETKDFSTLNAFERFILNRGYLYDTEEELKAGYDRVWKASHGLLVTAEEFEAEIKSRIKWDKELDILPLYEVLSSFVREKKLAPGDAFEYAVHLWCLRKPEALVAYTDGSKWLVNNCGEEISEEQARIKVCEEWGFEANRVRIIGTPYYDATDWQFIRFDCAHMTWLWKNGNLYQVYAD